MAAGAAAASVNFAVTIVDPVPAGTSSILNTARVADDGSNGPDPTPIDNEDSETTPLLGTPGLHLTKTDGDVTTVPGGVVVYTLRYWNDGDTEVYARPDGGGICIGSADPQCDAREWVDDPDTLDPAFTDAWTRTVMRAAQRLPQLPDVPTVAEQGFPGCEMTQWYGMLAPANLAPANLAKLAAETAEAAALAAVAEAKPLSMNAYKVTLARTVVKRALLAAVGDRYWEA